MSPGVDRFVADAEGCVILKPLAEKGKSGWLWRVYPEPWQLVAQGRSEAEVIQTSEARPPYEELISALLKAPTPP